MYITPEYGTVQYYTADTLYTVQYITVLGINEQITLFVYHFIFPISMLFNVA